MVVDLDSHLREGYFLDEVYRLNGPYAKYTPVKVTGGRDHRTHFLHSLEVSDARARAIFRHPYMYDPKYNPEVAERQIGGYDMERRLVDIRKEGIHKQAIFPTGIGIPTVNAGGLGLALCRAYNDWVVDSRYPHTVSEIRKRTDLTNQQKELILGGNAAGLLAL